MSNCSSSINPQSSQYLETVFQSCFTQKYSTVLKGNAPEPLYLPAKNLSAQNLPHTSTLNQSTLKEKSEHLHTIYYRLDYFSSALHEVAHWCIAGANRRLLEDYGYWYEPDGRDALQQLAFQQVEVKPQAIEMAFSIACGRSFKVSIDNLSASDDTNNIHQEKCFEQAVQAQYESYCVQGFPTRAAIFLNALKKAYSGNKQDQAAKRAIQVQHLNIEAREKMCQ